MILAIRSDTARAVLVLCNQKDGKETARIEPELGRSMAKDILSRLEELLTKQNAAWTDMSGIVVFRGPGSFTGLRIGITVANALAYSLSIPVVGTSGEGWLEDGVEELKLQHNDRIVLPLYGSEAHITKPRK